VLRRETEQKYLSVLVAMPTERAAKYCNVTSRTMQRIRPEINNCVTAGGWGKGSSMPGRTRKGQNVGKVEIDDFE
jgi:hypothetical protein